MYLRIIIHSILAISVSLFQISLLQSWQEWLGYFSLVLIFLLFVLSLSGLDKALIWAGVCGFIYDIYSFFPFGLFLLIFVLTLLLADFLLKNFFTDRSLYSFWALILIINLSFNLLFYSGVYIINWYVGDLPFFLLSQDFWSALLRGGIFSLIVVFFFFYASHFISNRLNAVFLKH